MEPGDVISYTEMVLEEDNTRVQRGMNYRIQDDYSIFLMSTREGAPYNDEIRNDGKTLIYEGHDARKDQVDDPKSADQPMHFSSGKLTQNGKFFEAAKDYQEGNRSPEPIKVYEKIKKGIWVYNGFFDLVDAWREEQNDRQVFKFKLQLAEDEMERSTDEGEPILEHARLIPMNVKREVWDRDEGECQECGAEDNLHFDHIIPYSKGGTSKDPENIQLLCARHNLSKSDNIQ